MRRDFELIRELLLEAQRLRGSESVAKSCEVGDPIHVHLEMLKGAGLIKSITIGDSASPTIIYGLTWEGHELIDFIGNSDVWESLIIISNHLRIPTSENMIEWHRSRTFSNYANATDRSEMIRGHFRNSGG